jgi:hypothetical protein
VVLEVVWESFEELRKIKINVKKWEVRRRKSRKRRENKFKKWKQEEERWNGLSDLLGYGDDLADAHRKLFEFHLQNKLSKVHQLQPDCVYEVLHESNHRHIHDSFLFLLLRGSSLIFGDLTGLKADWKRESFVFFPELWNLKSTYNLMIHHSTNDWSILQLKIPLNREHQIGRSRRPKRFTYKQWTSIRYYYFFQISSSGLSILLIIVF